MLCLEISTSDLFWLPETFLQFKYRIIYEVLQIFLSCKMRTLNLELESRIRKNANDCLLVIVTLGFKFLFVGSTETSTRSILVFLAAVCDCNELFWL